MEIILNIILVIFGILSNNWLSLLIALIFLLYNLYSRLRKKNSFNILIDDLKHNIDSSKKVGLEYKFKFIFYMIISIYALLFAIFTHVDGDESFQSLKIFG